VELDFSYAPMPWSAVDSGGSMIVEDALGRVLASLPHAAQGRHLALAHLFQEAGAALYTSGLRPRDMIDRIARLLTSLNDMVEAEEHKVVTCCHEFCQQTYRSAKELAWELEHDPRSFRYTQRCQELYRALQKVCDHFESLPDALRAGFDFAPARRLLADSWRA